MTGLDDELWRTTDVARYCDLSMGTITSYRQRGQMPTPVMTVGRTHLWRPADIIAWRDTLARQPPQRPGVPVYKTIAAALREQISNGTLLPGDRVPSENELAVAFSCSRPTATKGVDLLRREGIVTSNKRGTFVTSKPVGREDG